MQIQSNVGSIRAMSDPLVRIPVRTTGSTPRTFSCQGFECKSRAHKFVAYVILVFVAAENFSDLGAKADDNQRAFGRTPDNPSEPPTCYDTAWNV
jgi:hypothetical protein